MTDPIPVDEGLDCIVVGGGLAGLACAQRLASSGRRVSVLEAEESAGGRARTVWHRGRPVDRGFQVLFRSYPQTRRLLKAIGLPRRDLRPIDGGAVFVGPQGTSRLGTSKLAAVRFGGLHRRDRLLLMRLAASVVAQSPETLLAPGGADRSADEFLRERGFSNDALDRFFRPLFGVVTLDRRLGADEGYFRFLMSMLARGPAVIPSDGLGMVAEWSSAAVRQAGGSVELGVRVSGLEADREGRRVTGVRTEGGRLLRARHVVLAVEWPAARGLLGPLDAATADRLPRAVASSVSAAFALRRPLYHGRSIVLNAAPVVEPGSRVDLLCQTTNITRPGAPNGPHVLLATRVTTGGGGAEGMVEAVGELVGRWAPRFDWAGLAEPIGVYEHPYAQFRPLVGVRESLPGPRTAVENLVLAGDLTAHPSIEGAVSSGFRAAGIVDALTP